MADKVQCPNCLGEAEKTGNKITCLACDAILEIKKTGSAKVVKIGELEELKGRVGALEALLAPDPEPEKSSFVDDVEEQEDDILPP